MEKATIEAIVEADEKRVPASQNAVAHAVASNEPGVLNDPEAMYLSVRKMVRMLCEKKAYAAGEDPDDLEQDCALRLFRCMHRFSGARCSFSTFTYYICLSVLNSRIGKRANRHRLAPMVSDECLFDVSDGSHIAAEFRTQFREAVDELSLCYPDKKPFIRALFGGSYLDAGVSILDAAKASGMSYISAQRFFRKVVRPYFRSYFGVSSE